MGFLIGLLSVTAVLSCILLLVVILLQEPKGGGLAAALGGSGMEAIGVSVGGVNRFTGTVAAVWMVACFLLAVLDEPGTALDTPEKDKTEDTVEAPPETPPTTPPEKK